MLAKEIPEQSTARQMRRSQIHSLQLGQLKQSLWVGILCMHHSAVNTKEDDNLHTPGLQRIPTSRSWEQSGSEFLVVQLPSGTKLTGNEKLLGHRVYTEPVPCP